MKQLLGISGFAVALSATVLGWVLNNLSRKARQRPLLDADAFWHPRGFPAIPIHVRNRAETSMKIREVEILKPRGARIAWDAQGLYGMTPPFPDPTWRVFDLHDYSIFAGTGATLPFFFRPPEGWRSGTVQLRIAIAFQSMRRVRIKHYGIERQLVDAPAAPIA